MIVKKDMVLSRCWSKLDGPPAQPQTSPEDETRTELHGCVSCSSSPTCALPQLDRSAAQHQKSWRNMQHKAHCEAVFSTDPALPMIARLDEVPAQHQKMRRKAVRLLLRHTESAIEELHDDTDEMLRGMLALR